MSTKKQLAEQVLRKLVGGNVVTDTQLDIREIMLDLDQLRDNYVKNMYYENIKAGHYTIDQSFLSSYTEAVTGQSFTLSVRPISMPRNIGIYSVGESLAEPYAIIDSGQVGAFNAKAALNMANKIYVYFIGQIGTIIGTAPASVNVLIAASSESIDEVDDYPLTPDAEAIILDALFQKYAPSIQIPHDEVVDGQKSIISNG